MKSSCLWKRSWPTPGTISTCMFYTGLDPYTMEPVYVAKTPHDKAMQRALLQYYDPKNRQLCEEALRKAHRTDLIGNGKNCLIQAGSFTHRNSGKNGRNSYGKTNRKENGGKKR